MGKIQIYSTELGLSAMAAAIASKCGILGWLLIIFAFVMFADFVSGMLASKKESLEHPKDNKYGWSSKKGLIGIIKKFAYIIVVFAALAVDFLIYEVTWLLNVSIPMATFFSTLVTVWFILNELISIVENSGRMGVTGIPNFLVGIIAVLKDTVEESGNRIVETNEREEK